MPKIAGGLAIAIGVAAAWFYHRQGLTLSHYDAKAHLVVARRILDSITPEYSQIGAVWLPLPHLLNMLPVQIDELYRTGSSAVALSILSFALGCYAVARLVLQVTGSRLGALLALTLFALDPDILYLQSTPMTEPMLFGLTLLGVSLVYDWVERGGEGEPAAAGWVLIAACLTRYEAWLVTAMLVVLTPAALVAGGLRMAEALRRTAQLAVYPALAIVVFILHSQFTIGKWFVTGGFFVVDPQILGHPLYAFLQVVYGIRTLSNDSLVLLSVAGACVVLLRGLVERERSARLVVLALLGFLALPAYAFYEGHPFRMRYMIAPVVTVAVFCGIALGSLRGRFQAIAAAGLAIFLAATLRPLNPKAPMVQEAQWDRPNSRGRQAVTVCLMREYHHEPILASMGSLAHYMQELSHEGLNIRDFVHEGNLPYWQEDIESPKGRVGWILIEEKAEGGDVLAARARASSQFLLGFTRVCSGGGVALYRGAEGGNEGGKSDVKKVKSKKLKVESKKLKVES
ncbi:MAG TPA: hypothetical protein VGZ27_00460 [Vicinamibacterales bacterium]|nr:hypothetical protein [Vicinamibacterales bacterium]